MTGWCAVFDENAEQSFILQTCMFMRKHY